MSPLERKRLPINKIRYRSFFSSSSFFEGVGESHISLDRVYCRHKKKISSFSFRKHILLIFFLQASVSVSDDHINHHHCWGRHGACETPASLYHSGTAPAEPSHWEPLLLHGRHVWPISTTGECETVGDFIFVCACVCV